MTIKKKGRWLRFTYIRVIVLLSLFAITVLAVRVESKSSFSEKIHSVIFHSIAYIFTLRFRANEIKIAQLFAHIKKNQPVLLLDVRETVEQEVSIVRNAILSSPREDLSRNKAVIEFVKIHTRRKNNRDAIIVIYCAGGYRSARSESQLKSKIPLKVFSLHGGIVAYANAGGILIEPKSKKRLKIVHGYNRFWAMFVRPPILAVTKPELPN